MARPKGNKFIRKSIESIIESNYHNGAKYLEIDGIYQVNKAKRNADQQFKKEVAVKTIGDSRPLFDKVQEERTVNLVQDLKARLENKKKKI